MSENIKPLKVSKRNIILNILGKYKLIGSPLLWMIFFSLLIQILFLAYPFIGKKLIEIVETKGTTYELGLTFALGAVYIILTLLGDGVIKIYSDTFKSEFSNKLHSAYRALIGKFQIHTITDLGTGKLISKFEQGIDAEKSIFFNLLETIIICGIRGLGVLILYLYYDYRIFVIMLGVIILYLLLEYVLKGKIESLGDKEREIYEQKSSNLVRYISEFQTIKLHNKIDFENKGFNEIIQPLPLISRMRSILSNGKDYFLETFFDVGDKAIIFYFGYIALTSGYSIADIFMLSGFIRRLRWPLSQFVNSVSTLQYNITKYQNLQEFLNTPQTISNGTDSYQYKNGDMHLDNVTFSYNEDKQILQDFSLHVPGGKTLALVGNSGSGKSTIIKLLLRLYDPQSGSIMIDNQNLKNLEIETLYDNIGYLTQEPAVFDGSIYDNMMYGAPRDVIARNGAERNNEVTGNNVNQIATSEQNGFPASSQGVDNLIRQALDHAKCDFVRSMKDGLETQIGERGVKLSGGERQRLAIARIFFKNPHILILDEPTAALDSISEHHITTTLHDLFVNKTVIVIAHRLQTVMNADQIIVLNEGTIVQSGKHNELLSQDGLYKQLVDLQSGVVKEE